MKILVALGGNAILPRGDRGTVEEQYSAIAETCKHLGNVLAQGHQLVVTHGNGPQVGDILLAYEAAKELVPPMPLDVCGAESQGMIGYMLQQSLENEVTRRGMNRPVVTLLTRTEVKPDDPAFKKPTKPVGPFYPEKEVQGLEKKGWVMKKDGKDGFRRVVASPVPISILELPTLKKLFAGGTIVIAGGGGGVPVARQSGEGPFRGVGAVIDKDLSSSLLARELGVDLFLILTDVDGLYEKFGEPGQKLIAKITPSEARRRVTTGEFPAGSMGPKVAAASEFVEATGKRAVVSSLSAVEGAVAGSSGTQFVPG